MKDKPKYCNYAVLDVETGGRLAAKNPIVQIALVIIDGVTLNEIARYQNYVKPYQELEIEQAALDYNGISMRDIEQHGVDYRKVVKEMITLLKETRVNSHVAYKPLIVGHNVQFDIGFISQMFKFAKEDLFKHTQPDYWCTMRLDQLKNYKDKIVGYKLEDCCDRVGIELIDGHDAMNDTLATKDLFIHHVQSLRSSEGAEVSSSDTERFRDEFVFELPV